jgi:hypothetical protein
MPTDPFDDLAQSVDDELGFSSTSSSGGATLTVEFHNATDKWAVVSDTGATLETYGTKDAAKTAAEKRVSNQNSKFGSVNVESKSGGMSGGMDFGL